jgi:ssDNA-binding Zn-finger/Zn-ribbon topoisomerase 1
VTAPAHVVPCGECGAPMALRDGAYGRFWGCSRWPACNGVHGAHPSGAPLGVPANAETRLARIGAHTAFDRVWQSGSMSRRGAYRWMQKVLRLSSTEAHIGRLTLAQCRALERAVETLFRRIGTPSESSNRNATATDPETTKGDARQSIAQVETAE